MYRRRRGLRPIGTSNCNQPPRELWRRLAEPSSPWPASTGCRGQAGHIGIRISREEGGATLRVSDDGIGFDPTTAADSGRFGLISMRERDTEVGASLEVHSVPGQGTTVEGLWP